MSDPAENRTYVMLINPEDEKAGNAEPRAYRLLASDDQKLDVLAVKTSIEKTTLVRMFVHLGIAHVEATGAIPVICLTEETKNLSTSKVVPTVNKATKGKKMPHPRHEETADETSSTAVSHPRLNASNPV